VGRPANFKVIFESENTVVIKDIGPWDVHFTVTNDAEGVVKRLAPMLNGRRLFYYDSEGDYDEILVRDGKFRAFAPGPRER
jgi:hypothetical protein